MLSVVANGSSLAYVKNAGVSLSTLRLSHLCDLALDQWNEKDAMTQGRKDWKPQNPSESGNFNFLHVHNCPLSSFL